MQFWFKKSFKIFLVLIAVWFVSIFTLLKYPLSGFGDSILSTTKTETTVRNGKTKSAKTLRRIDDSIKGDDKKMNKSRSAFRAWDLINRKSENIELSEKYSILKQTDMPPGANGTGVLLIDGSKIKGNLRWMVNTGYQNYGFNDFVNDLIPINRSLPDYRDKWCKSQRYAPSLSKVSVVITFFNEAWSTLIRTIHSVLDRTPDHLLKEIILMDDSSYMLPLMIRLEIYIKLLPKVRLLRGDDRMGVIKAKVLAAKAAEAPVVVFLDSHCEVTEGWLEPLLDRIARSPTTIATPTVDEIDKNTFEYKPEDVNNLKIGGFDWKLNFVWNIIPQEHFINMVHPAQPRISPVLPGGIFAIDKGFFAHLGYYDKGFDLFGGENMELSFKTWMCGGRIEILPCSHIGHVLKKGISYKSSKMIDNKNAIRIAQVWLDDYAKYFYETIGNNIQNVGSVEQRKRLREQRNCKSFEWYLKNINFHMVIPNSFAGRGNIINMNNERLCLDSVISQNRTEDNVILTKCQRRGGNQYWIYSKQGEIKQGRWCLDYDENLKLVLNLCTGRLKTQMWLYKATTHHIMNMRNLLCLRATKQSTKWGLTLKKCSYSVKQKWIIPNFRVDSLDPELQILSKSPPFKY